MTTHLGLQRIMIPGSQVSALTTGNITLTGARGAFTVSLLAEVLVIAGDGEAFIAPKPFASWVLNESTCLWEAPTPMPTDGERYSWNEATVAWEVTAL